MCLNSRKVIYNFSDNKLSSLIFITFKTDPYKLNCAWFINIYPSKIMVAVDEIYDMNTPE